MILAGFQFLFGKQWVLKFFWWLIAGQKSDEEPAEGGDGQEEEGMSKLQIEIEIVKYIAWAWAVYFAYQNYKNNAQIRGGEKSLF